MSRWEVTWAYWQERGRVYQPPGSLVDFVQRYDYWERMAAPADLRKERSPWS